MLALREFFRKERVAIWPEVEAQICEGTWIHDHLDRGIPPQWRPHSLYLSLARSRLQSGERGLVELPAQLGGMRVAAWADAASLKTRGQITEIERTAASKRRLYRRFLTWTSSADLCGHVAENLVGQVLQDLHGTNLWIPPGTVIGRVRSLLGRPIAVGGPLDAHAHWAINPHNPNDGFIPFAAEVKNIRAVLYPWSTETWDLLAKAGAFPEVVPVLVGRRIHATTFRFFKDIGALGSELRSQLFSHTIESADFARVTGGLRLSNAVQLQPGAMNSSVARGLTRFFRDLGPTLAREHIQKWSRAAPICDKFKSLRTHHDHETWVQFAREIVEAGLHEHRGWVPPSALGEEPPEPDDWMDEEDR